ncbi:MAG: OmpA family protein [Kofleriaceae bacterium]
MRRDLIALALCLTSGLAAAQGIDGERFVPAISADGGFVLEQPTVPYHLGWGLGLFLNYANNELVVRDSVTGAVTSKPIATAVTTDLVGSIGLFGRLELGVHLPVHLIYDGDPYGALNATGGIGDLRFLPKVAIVRAGGVENHVVIGLAMPISLPTGDDLALRGAGGVTLTPELLFGAYLGPFSIGFDAGYRYRAEHPANLPWGDEITLGPWVAYAFTDRVAGHLELLAEKEVSASVTGADFPTELLAGIDAKVTNNWDLYAGASFGITDGLGDPRFRIIGGVRYRHGVPERQGFEDQDHDGVLDKDDRCPNEAEDRDGFEDEDGCPEADNDEDGIPDEDDECPDLSGDREHRGCPAHTYVKIENGKIFIFGKVQFRSGSAVIDRNSEPLLDQIAQGLNANSQVKHVRIEGYTDNVGDPRINQRLSEARANAVKDALERRHVDSDRLVTRGFGENRPIAPNASAGGRQKNRRVEFVIMEGK